MKSLMIHSIVFSLAMPSLANAGFRPAVDQPHAVEVHNISRFTTSYSGNAASAPATNAPNKSASTQPTIQNKLPGEVKNANNRMPANKAMFPTLPQAKPALQIPSTQKNVNNDFGPQMPGKKPNAPMSNKPNQKNQKIADDKTLRPQTPVPHAPALPEFNKFQIPEMQMPVVSKNRNPLEAIPRFQINGKNREQMEAAVKKALAMKMPLDKSYTMQARSPEIVSKYKDALNPFKHKVIRTPVQLALNKTSKINNPPSEVAYENMVKRIDALFQGLNLTYAPSVQALWELSQAKENPIPLQARDALFGGIISQRAGWEVSARYLMEESASKSIDKQDRYLHILFANMQNFENLSHIDSIAEKINAERVRDVAPQGDKANYAMARRALASQLGAKISISTFSDKIADPALKDKIAYLSAMKSLQSADKKEEAVAVLKNLESNGDEGIQQEARLALARVVLQKGNNAEALALYQNIKKDGKNRLEVTAEQTYAEYKMGMNQESLGKVLGLQSPYFQYGFAPDIHVVEVLNRKAMCDFGGAEQGLARFSQRYVRELTALSEVISRHVAPKNFYDEVISYHAEEKPLRFQRNLLHLPAVMENQKTMNGAEKEIKKIAHIGLNRYPENRPKGWEKFVSAVRQNWDNRANKLKVESGNVALKEVEYMAERLKKTFAQTELLAIDVATGASRNFNMQSALNFPVKKVEEAKVDQEKLHWPFEDEIWEDELDHLKTQNPSKCAKVAGSD